VVQGGRAYWTHLGDSRLYLVRKGEVLVRTRDHTFVQELLDQGLLRPEEAAGHPERNRLQQCLGSTRAPLIQPASHARLERDDVVLLCSDGFWGPLAERRIVAGLESGTLAEGIARLSRAAIRATRKARCWSSSATRGCCAPRAWRRACRPS
jgi:PPM family protein phosphatase